MPDPTLRPKAIMPPSPKSGRDDGRLGNAECAAALAEQIPTGDIIFAAESSRPCSRAAACTGAKLLPISSARARD